MQSIAIIGLGTMGSFIKERFAGKFDLILVDNNVNLSEVKNADLIIIAVKPQQFEPLSKELSISIGDGQIIVSIMAGIKLKHIKSALKTNRIVRTMPNLAIRNGQSMTAAFSEDMSLEDKVAPILKTWGSYIWLEKEELFDAYTALAGSGPAYFFRLAEEIKLAALSYGFSEEEADNIAIKTFQGAASVIDGDPSKWVHKVMSPGGTTQAAMDVLSQDGFDEIIAKAIDNAKRRSEELSNNG